MDLLNGKGGANEWLKKKREGKKRGRGVSVKEVYTLATWQKNKSKEGNRAGGGALRNGHRPRRTLPRKRKLPLKRSSAERKKSVPKK